MAVIKIYTDGGARRNPGPAGAGVVILDQKNQLIKKIHKFLGELTNNQAEYHAVIIALDEILKMSQNSNTAEYGNNFSIECFLDSELIVEQLNQRYKIKNEGLKLLFWQVREQVIKLGGKVTFSYIPREQNRQADKLVNQAIDKRDKQENRDNRDD